MGDTVLGDDSCKKRGRPKLTSEPRGDMRYYVTIPRERSMEHHSLSTPIL